MRISDWSSDVCSSDLQRGDKVFVRARRSDTDEVETIEADYVVGADGARSKVRDAIGATMVGTRSRTGYYNFIIHAPGLHQAHDNGPGVVYWQFKPEIPSILANMAEGDVLYLRANVGLVENGFCVEEVVVLVKTATGQARPTRSFGR